MADQNPVLSKLEFCAFVLFFCSLSSYPSSPSSSLMTTLMPKSLSLALNTTPKPPAHMYSHSSTLASPNVSLLSHWAISQHQTPRKTLICREIQEDVLHFIIKSPSFTVGQASLLTIVFCILCHEDLP